MIPLIIIEGATASGKTSLALELAQKFQTEIISADSRQVYKLLNIGTAKPSKDELTLVRHHLIDIINPDESFNAGLFRKKAITIINRLHTQGKIPIICGGTGLYIKALLEGLFTSDVHDKEIRVSLEAENQEKGLSVLHDRLSEIDPETAMKVSSNDKQRIYRALEVYLATGIPLSEHWKKQKREEEFKTYRILLREEREVLYKRIDARILSMIKMGLIDEIQSILDRGYSWQDPGFNSVGCKEFRPFIETGKDLDKCIELAQQHTRNYAKRQSTWYRKCNFNLAEAVSSISINSVEAEIKRLINT